MFVRRKPNKSGVVSVQVISKTSGRYQVVKTIGSSKDTEQIKSLEAEGERYISSLTKQSTINFELEKERSVIDLFFKGIESIRLAGPGKTTWNTSYCKSPIRNIFAIRWWWAIAGVGPVIYVKEVLQRYDEYKLRIES